MDQMMRGWFIGNFEPSVYKTSNFEVGYLRHKRGEIWEPHYHKYSREINYLIRGKMIVRGVICSAGDIFTLEQSEVADPQFLEDCELICVKIPSIPNDKYKVKIL